MGCRLYKACFGLPRATTCAKLPWQPDREKKHATPTRSAESGAELFIHMPACLAHNTMTEARMKLSSPAVIICPGFADLTDIHPFRLCWTRKPCVSDAPDKH